MIVVPSFSRKTICALSSRIVGEGDEAGNVRKTKVQGWRIRVRLERRVGSEASPGAEVMFVECRTARTVSL